MKRALLFLILLLTFTWPSAAGQSGESLMFDDLGLGGGTANSGTYNSNDTFSFDVILTFNGYSATGLSFWLETNTAFAGSLSITGLTYGTAFPNHNNATFPILFDSGAGADAGYLSESFDLGSSSNNGVSPGPYIVVHVNFAISGATPGTYDLRSTVIAPHASEVTSFDGTTFADHNLPGAHYSVTIAPEPATIGLLGLGAAGLMAVLLRRGKR